VEYFLIWVNTVIKLCTLMYSPGLYIEPCITTTTKCPPGTELYVFDLQRALLLTHVITGGLRLEDRVIVVHTLGSKAATEPEDHAWLHRSLEVNNNTAGRSRETETRKPRWSSPTEDERSASLCTSFPESQI